MTLENLLKKASEHLSEKTIEDPSLEAGLLLSWFLKKDIGYIYANPDIVLDGEQKKLYLSLIERRGRHEPFAYITGECGFLDYIFYVNPHVLIPRDDTELLAQGALFALGQNPPYFNQSMFRLKEKTAFRVLDVGTGSGCLAVSIAKSSPSVFVDAVDVSGEALNIARKNSKRYNVEDQISFMQADFLDKNLTLSGNYDLIISNPPYIPLKDISFLMNSVRDYEPHLALVAGEDGLIFYRELAKRASSLLSEFGIILVECGYDQGDKVSEMFSEISMKTLMLKDLSGINRVVVATRK
ncbi:MAG: peptide chain release factor N(5)-glutamine methyltransferase [Clostridiaceae bacterium]|nr:peptide chain release factor N(5)-glutamine methyltransferase [Clostridiaceae bacterium]